MTTTIITAILIIIELRTATVMHNNSQHDKIDKSNIIARGIIIALERIFHAIVVRTAIKVPRQEVLRGLRREARGGDRGPLCGLLSRMSGLGVQG